MAGEKPENRNTAAVNALYKALASGGGTEREARRVLASDLQWWLHGPQSCHNMMRVLTGESAGAEFKFEPRSASAIEDGWVIVEGWEGAQAYWVHVRKVRDGLVTQFRESFSAWLTVTELINIGRSSPTLWQSRTPYLVDCSLPGLVLAI